MNRTLNLAALTLLLVLACASCSSLPAWVPLSSNHVPSKLAPEDVPDAIERAERALERDDTATAIDWLRSASRSTGLTAVDRDRVQILLEKACARHIEVASADPEGADELADLVDVDLPRQLAVEAGLRSAARLIAEDRSLDAFEVLKKLDTKFPMHHERQRAGDLMCDIGLEAIQDGPGFLGFWSTRDEGQAILEYAVLNAPWAKRCDEAYRALYQLYEADHEWDLAIARAEQIVLNHPASPLRAEAQATVPRLRLASIKSPEYDRSAISRARVELVQWLETYAGRSDLEERVRIDLGDALRRLSDNDLIVSRFYERVDNAYGARRHAERAVEEAREAGDLEREHEARAWLERLPPAPTVGAAAGAQP